MKQLIVDAWLEYSEIGVIFGISSRGKKYKIINSNFHGGQYITGINFSSRKDNICFIQFSNVSG